jgi:hypothetical protein
MMFKFPFDSGSFLADERRFVAVAGLCTFKGDLV